MADLDEKVLVLLLDRAVSAGINDDISFVPETEARKYPAALRPAPSGATETVAWEQLTRWLLRNATLGLCDDGDRLCVWINLTPDSETEPALVVVCEPSGDDGEVTAEDAPFLTDAQRADINGSTPHARGYVDDLDTIIAAIRHVADLAPAPLTAPPAGSREAVIQNAHDLLIEAWAEKMAHTSGVEELEVIQVERAERYRKAADALLALVGTTADAPAPETEDTKRLDWLESIADLTTNSHQLNYSAAYHKRNGASLRTVIDANRTLDEFAVAPATDMQLEIVRRIESEEQAL